MITSIGIKETFGKIQLFHTKKQPTRNRKELPQNNKRQKEKAHNS